MGLTDTRPQEWTDWHWPDKNQGNGPRYLRFLSPRARALLRFARPRYFRKISCKKERGKTIQCMCWPLGDKKSRLLWGALYRQVTVRASNKREGTPTHNTFLPYLASVNNTPPAPSQDETRRGRRWQPVQTTSPTLSQSGVAKSRQGTYLSPALHFTLPHLISSHMVIRYEYLTNRMVGNLPTKCQQTQTQTDHGQPPRPRPKVWLAPMCQRKPLIIGI